MNIANEIMRILDSGMQFALPSERKVFSYSEWAQAREERARRGEEQTKQRLVLSDTRPVLGQQTENKLAIAAEEVARCQPTSADWRSWSLECSTSMTLPFGWDRKRRVLFMSKSQLLLMTADSIKQHVRCAMAHAMCPGLDHDGMFSAYVEEFGAIYIAGPCSACALNKIGRRPDKKAVTKWRRQCPKADCKKRSVVVRHLLDAKCDKCETPYVYNRVDSTAVVHPKRKKKEAKETPVIAPAAGSGSGSGSGSGTGSGSGPECPVCMESYSKTQACALRCGHMMCMACLGTMKKSRPGACACPTCRAVYLAGEERKVFL